MRFIVSAALHPSVYEALSPILSPLLHVLTRNFKRKKLSPELRVFSRNFVRRGICIVTGKLFPWNSRLLANHKPFLTKFPATWFVRVVAACRQLLLATKPGRTPNKETKVKDADD